MTILHQVRGSAYARFVDFVEDAGAPIWRWQLDALVPEIVRENPESLVPIHLAHSFLDKGARFVGLPDFGFVAGKTACVADLGAFGRSLQRSVTLYDALCKIRSGFALYSSAENVWWYQVGANIHFHHAYKRETGAGSRYAQQCGLLLMRDLVRLAAGGAWQPKEVFSTNPTTDKDAFERTFDGAHVRYSDDCGFTFTADMLSWPLRPISTDTELGGNSHSGAYRESAPSTDMSGSLRQVIAILMKHKRCRLHDVADAVGLNPRTLQRHLSDSRLEFSEALAHVRFETALKMMGDPGLGVFDIAEELGYADPTNFTRAFRRWTGMSPTKYRRLARN